MDIDPDTSTATRSFVSKRRTLPMLSKPVRLFGRILVSFLFEEMMLARNPAKMLRQFISSISEEAEAVGLPVISIDTKKKGLQVHVHIDSKTYDIKRPIEESYRKRLAGQVIFAPELGQWNYLVKPAN